MGMVKPSQIPEFEKCCTTLLHAGGACMKAVPVDQARDGGELDGVLARGKKWFDSGCVFTELMGLM